MILTDYLLNGLKSLSEIELDVVLNDLKGHLEKNDMEHLLKPFADEVAIEEATESLHDEIERIKNEALTYMAALSTINDECEDNLFVDDVDTLKKFLKRVKELSE